MQKKFNTKKISNFTLYQLALEKKEEIESTGRKEEQKVLKKILIEEKIFKKQ